MLLVPGLSEVESTYHGAAPEAIPLHMLFLDGAYVDGSDESARFRRVSLPTSQELTQLTQTIARQVGRSLDLAIEVDSFYQLDTVREVC
jgi:hypothetical protein